MSNRKRRRRHRHRHRDLATSISMATRHEGHPTTLRLIACDGQTTHEAAVPRATDLVESRQRWPVIWVDVEGVEDLATIRSIGEVFEIGELALEDAVTPDERPKVEVFGHQVLIAVRRARYEGEAVITEPVAIFLGDRYVLTFREHGAPDAFDGVRQRIRSGRTRLGDLGADHLCAPA